MFTIYSCHRCFLVKLCASFHWFRLHLDVFHSHWVAPQRAWASYSNTAKSPVVCDTNTTQGCRGDGDSGCTVLPWHYKILTVHYPALIDYSTVLVVVSSCWWFVFDKSGNTKIRDPQSSRLLNVVTDVCSCRSLWHSIQSTSWTKAWRSSSRRSGEASTWSPTSLRSSTCSDQRRSSCWFVEAGWEFFNGCLYVLVMSFSRSFMFVSRCRTWTS